MSFSLKLEIIFYIYDSDRLCGGYQSGLKDNPLSAFSCQEVISPVGSAPFGSLIRIYTSWVSGYFLRARYA